MKLATMMLGACGLASAACAQSVHLSVMSRIDGGSDWTTDLGSVLPGQRVQVGVFMSGEGVYGFGGATLRLTATGAVGDTAAFAEGTSTGRVGPFNFGAATNAIFATADGWRIDAASDVNNNNANAGFTFFQRDPATAAPGTFSTANPALVFRFDVTLSASDIGRTITMSLDQLSRDVATYYLQGDSRPRQVTATMHAGTINLLGVPTPGAMSVLAGAWLLAARPRR